MTVICVRNIVYHRIDDYNLRLYISIKFWEPSWCNFIINLNFIGNLKMPFCLKSQKSCNNNWSLGWDLTEDLPNSKYQYWQFNHDVAFSLVDSNIPFNTVLKHPSIYAPLLGWHSTVRGNRNCPLGQSVSIRIWIMVSECVAAMTGKCISVSAIKSKFIWRRIRSYNLSTSSMNV